MIRSAFRSTALEDGGRLASRIQISMDDLAAWCIRWHVVELAVFDSVMRDDFDRESDIDFLVRFDPAQIPSLFSMAAMERELEELAFRKIHIVHRAAIEYSRNYIRREAILGSAQVLFAT